MSRESEERYQVLFFAEGREVFSDPESHSEAFDRATALQAQGFEVLSLMTIEGARARAHRKAEAENCVFCDIVSGASSAEMVVERDYWPDVIAFAPLSPLTKGHVLLVPKRHVRDFAENPGISEKVMRRASELMKFTDRPMVIFSTKGEEAGQEIMHFHLHLIPSGASKGVRLVRGKS